MTSVAQCIWDHVPTFFRMQIQSAEFCPDTTSNLWACPIWNYPSLLLPVKDNLGLRTPGVYRITCECGSAYNGQTGLFHGYRLIMQHHQHIPLEHTDKSAVAEHSIDQGHRIQFHSTSILSTKTRCVDRIVKEASEIELTNFDMNRGAGFPSADHGRLLCIP
jgi:hypothetical protein